MNEWMDEDLIHTNMFRNQCYFNTLSPNIHIQIRQTDFHTFLLIMVERIWFKIKSFSL